MKPCKSCDKEAVPFRKGYCMYHYGQWLFSEDGKDQRAKFLRSNQKKLKSEKAKEKRKAVDELRTDSELKNLLQIQINKLVRLIDKDKPCISCGHFPFTRQAHASHYYSIGSHPELRFNLFNIYKSCSICNNHKSGNIQGYNEGLANIGELERTQSLKGSIKELKLSKERMFELIKIVKQIIKEYDQKPLQRSEIQRILNIYS